MFRQFLRLRRGTAAAGLAGSAAAAGALYAFARDPVMASSSAEEVASYYKQQYKNGFQGDQDLAPERTMPQSPVHSDAHLLPSVNRAGWEEPPKKRVAVYGGSFNPITNAHLNCAAEIIHSKLADEVWIVPCGTRPDKPSLRTSGLHRLIMCHLAVDTTFGSRFGVKVCDEEMHYPRNMPSIVLMRHLKTQHPAIDFSFVIGSDLINQLKEWDAPGCPGAWEGIPNAGEKFAKEGKFLVISRPGSGIKGDEPLPENFEWIGHALNARGSKLVETFLSSSEVRNRLRGADDVVRYGLRKGQDDPPRSTGIRGVVEQHTWYDEAEGLVPPSVLAHIVRYGLYARD